MPKAGRYGAPRPGLRGNRSRGTGSGGGVDPCSNVRLEAVHETRRRENIRREIYGENDKAARSGVSLPKFSFDKEGA